MMNKRTVYRHKGPSRSAKSISCHFPFSAGRRLQSSTLRAILHSHCTVVTRMGGEASKILPGLYHGGSNQLEEAGFFESRGVTHVLSVCDRRPSERPGLEVKHIAIQDLPNADLGTHFEIIVKYIHRSRACPNQGFRQQLRIFRASGRAQAVGLRVREAFPSGEPLLNQDREVVAIALREMAVQGPVRDNSDETVAALMAGQTQLPQGADWGLTWVPEEAAKQRHEAASEEEDGGEADDESMDDNDEEEDGESDEDSQGRGGAGEQPPR